MAQKSQPPPASDRESVAGSGASCATALALLLAIGYVAAPVLGLPSPWPKWPPGTDGWWLPPSPLLLHLSACLFPVFVDSFFLSSPAPNYVLAWTLYCLQTSPSTLSLRFYHLPLARQLAFTLSRVSSFASSLTLINHTHLPTRSVIVGIPAIITPFSQIPRPRNPFLDRTSRTRNKDALLNQLPGAGHPRNRPNLCCDRVPRSLAHAQPCPPQARPRRVRPQ